MKFLVYVAVLLSTAACLALGLDFLTRPEPASKLSSAQTAAVASKGNADTQDQTASANGAIRQIPIIGKANAGDPNNDLMPIYPATPGKDLPVKDAAAAQKDQKDTLQNKDTPQNKDIVQNGAPAKQAAATAPAPNSAPTPAPDATNGTAPNGDAAMSVAVAAPSPTLRSSLQTQSAAPNSCNVAACAAAYRSFRESDCSYQPYDGPRKICENPPEAGGASPQQAAIDSQPQPQQMQPYSRPREYRPAQTVRDNRDVYNAELQDAARTVRRLPAPNAGYQYDDDDAGPAMPPPDMSRYGLRRNWVIERE